MVAHASRVGPAAVRCGRSGPAHPGPSADLGDLRSALERAEVGRGRAAGLRVLGELVAGLGRGGRQRAAGSGRAAPSGRCPAPRRRRGTARAGRRPCRARPRPSGDDAAQEPARTVDADEPGRLHAGCRPAARTGTRVRSSVPSGPSTSSAVPPCWVMPDRISAAHVVPDALAARRGERLDLQGAVAEDEGHRHDLRWSPGRPRSRTSRPSAVRAARGRPGRPGRPRPDRRPRTRRTVRRGAAPRRPAAADAARSSSPSGSSTSEPSVGPSVAATVGVVERRPAGASCGTRSHLGLAWSGLWSVAVAGQGARGREAAGRAVPALAAGRARQHARPRGTAPARPAARRAGRSGRRAASRTALAGSWLTSSTLISPR